TQASTMNPPKLIPSDPLINWFQSSWLGLSLKRRRRHFATVFAEALAQAFGINPQFFEPRQCAIGQHLSLEQAFEDHAQLRFFAFVAGGRHIPRGVRSGGQGLFTLETIAAKRLALGPHAHRV